MFSFLKRKKTARATATPLSEFVRNASSAKKKKAYESALRKASDSQNAVIERRKRRVGNTCNA
jgi:hypothetical protein